MRASVSLRLTIGWPSRITSAPIVDTDAGTSKLRSALRVAVTTTGSRSTSTAVCANASVPVMSSAAALAAAARAHNDAARNVLPIVQSKLIVFNPAPSKRSLATARALLQQPCLLYTSDAADDLLCVDLGG